MIISTLPWLITHIEEVGLQTDHPPSHEWAERGHGSWGGRL